MVLKIHKLQNTSKNAKENQIKCCDTIGAGRVSVGGHICTGLCWMSGIQQRKLLKVSTETCHGNILQGEIPEKKRGPWEEYGVYGGQGEERSVV